jgi:putative protease
MVLQNGTEKLTLRFDCKPCEMHVMGKIRKNILLSPPPGSESTIQFYKTQPKRG